MIGMMTSLTKARDDRAECGADHDRYGQIYDVTAKNECLELVQPSPHDAATFPMSVRQCWRGSGHRSRATHRSLQ